MGLGGVLMWGVSRSPSRGSQRKGVSGFLPESGRPPALASFLADPWPGADPAVPGAQATVIRRAGELKWQRQVLRSLGSGRRAEELGRAVWDFTLFGIIFARREFSALS